MILHNVSALSKSFLTEAFEDKVVWLLSLIRSPALGVERGVEQQVQREASALAESE